MTTRSESSASADDPNEEVPVVAASESRVTTPLSIHDSELERRWRAFRSPYVQQNLPEEDTRGMILALINLPDEQAVGSSAAVALPPSRTLDVRHLESELLERPSSPVETVVASIPSPTARQDAVALTIAAIESMKIGVKSSVSSGGEPSSVGFRTPTTSSSVVFNPLLVQREVEAEDEALQQELPTEPLFQFPRMDTLRLFVVDGENVAPTLLNAGGMVDAGLVRDQDGLPTALSSGGQSSSPPTSSSVPFSDGIHDTGLEELVPFRQWQARQRGQIAPQNEGAGDGIGLDLADHVQPLPLAVVAPLPRAPQMPEQNDDDPPINGMLQMEMEDYNPGEEEFVEQYRDLGYLADDEDNWEEFRHLPDDDDQAPFPMAMQLPNHHHLQMGQPMVWNYEPVQLQPVHHHTVHIHVVEYHPAEFQPVEFQPQPVPPYQPLPYYQPMPNDPPFVNYGPLAPLAPPEYPYPPVNPLPPPNGYQAQDFRPRLVPYRPAPFANAAPADPYFHERRFMPNPNGGYQMNAQQPQPPMHPGQYQYIPPPNGVQYNWGL